jgi:hypothetical protein
MSTRKAFSSFSSFYYYHTSSRIKVEGLGIPTAEHGTAVGGVMASVSIFLPKVIGISTWGISQSWGIFSPNL